MRGSRTGRFDFVLLHYSLSLCEIFWVPISANETVSPGSRTSKQGGYYPRRTACTQRPERKRPMSKEAFRM